VNADKKEEKKRGEGKIKIIRSTLFFFKQRLQREKEKHGICCEVHVCKVHRRNIIFDGCHNFIFKGL